MGAAMRVELAYWLTDMHETHQGRKGLRSDRVQASHDFS
jgi:hypothetical protein